MSYDQKLEFNEIITNIETSNIDYEKIFLNENEITDYELKNARNRILLSDRISLAISKLKKKFTYSKVTWVFFLFLLFSIVTTSVVFAMKNNFTPVKNEIKSEVNYDEKFLGKNDNLVYRQLKNIDKIDFYENLTTWANKAEEVYFKKELIDKNIIKTIRPYIVNDVGENNYYQIRYKLQTKWKLFLDIRWCKKEANKLVGDVFHDYIELNLKH